MDNWSKFKAEKYSTIGGMAPLKSFITRCCYSTVHCFFHSFFHVISLAVALFLPSWVFFFFFLNKRSSWLWLIRSHCLQHFLENNKQIYFLFSFPQVTVQRSALINRCESSLTLAWSINHCRLLSWVWQFLTASHVYWSIWLLGDRLDGSLMC